MLKIRFLRNFPAGLAIGAIAAFLLAWAIDTEIGVEAKSNWPYLLTAAVALVSASLAVAAALASIDNQNILHQDLIERKFRSAKAMLPTALSELSGIAELAIDDLLERLDHDRSGNSAPFQHTQLQSLSLSQNAMEVLKEVIELSPSDRDSKYLTYILSRHQIYVSRWEGNFLNPGQNDVVYEDEIFSEILDWVYFLILSDCAFHYARGLSNEIDPDVLDGGLRRRLVELSHLKNTVYLREIPESLIKAAEAVHRQAFPI